MKTLLKYKNLYFLGILGSSMKNLAVFCKKLGFSVRGADKNSKNCPSFADILVKEKASEEDAVFSDLVVYSSAIPNDSQDVALFENFGVECVSRGEFLAKFSELFHKVVAVSGTHGKTTVTAMIGEAFYACGLYPAVHIGGNYPEKDFKMDYFVTEACEYKTSFLSLRPDISIVLNAEYDHPDCFSSRDEVMSAFSDFIQNTKPDGAIILGEENLTHKNALYLSRECSVKDSVLNGDKYSFTPVIRGKIYPKVNLSVPGEHNAKNALTALLVCDILSLDRDKVCQAISNFQGVDRRYQKVARYGREYVLDYAHHPTEIKCSLSTARKTGKKLVVYFQPHTFSRTKALFSDFIAVLKEADEVNVVEEFSARETPDMGLSAYDLYQALKSEVKSSYIPKSRLKTALYEERERDRVVLVLGAGDIDKYLI